MGQFLNPVNGHRGKQAAAGIKPKNHMKDNLRAIRNAQEKHREDREESSRPKEEPFKLSQFREVNSRVWDENEQVTPSESQREYLPKGMHEIRQEEKIEQARLAREQLKEKMEEARYYANKPTTPRKPIVPKEQGRLARPTGADFIARNRVKAITSVPKANNDTTMNRKHEEYGRVPEYLEDRKMKWEEEKAEVRRRAPDPNCPPGMCLMPDDERRDTLEVLNNSKTEAMHQLRKLPIVVETCTLKKKQESLETKLREIENAILIFSKPKVYVQSR